MKIIYLIPALLSVLTGLSPSLKAETPPDFQVGKYYNAAEKLNFSDDDEEKINAYYGDIGTKTGSDLLSYLYTRISDHKGEDKKYYLDYGSGIKGVGQWYQLTDRNWALSEEVTPENFTFLKAKSPKAGSLFLYNMYVSDKSNNDKTKAFSNLINGYKQVQGSTKIDYTKYTRPKSVQVDKEHVWAKNHGFKVKKDGSDSFEPGAPTDLHHLVAADHNTNSAGHNDRDYGNVKEHSEETEVYAYLADGTKEVSGWLDKKNDIFEPTDEWKGDVARCLFYMATRYSLKKAKNTQAEPYLCLTDDTSYRDDDALRDDDQKIFHGVGYHLSDLLEWNEKDPVSTYEIHRNNLIYHNIQDNRNPYIDHPEWVRRVFDKDFILNPKEDKEKQAKALKNSYNLHIGTPLDLGVDLGAIGAISNTDENVVMIRGSTVTPKKEGKSIVTVTFEDGTTKKITFAVKEALKIDLGEAYEDQNIALTYGGSLTLSPTLTNNFPEEKVLFLSDNERVVKVEGNTLLAKGIGKANIQVCAGETELMRLSVNVKFSQRTLLIIIIVASVILVLLIIILLVAVNHRKKKRSHKKRYNR